MTGRLAQDSYNVPEHGGTGYLYAAGRTSLSETNVECVALRAWPGMRGPASVGLRAWGCVGATLVVLRAWRCVRGAACVGLRAWGCVRGAACAGLRTWRGMRGAVCVAPAFMVSSSPQLSPALRKLVLPTFRLRFAG